MKQLYHYIHCPYCIRVRMALGFLGFKYKSIVLSYSDEDTPKNLTGEKMLPILQDENGLAINESLDIIQLIDKDNLLKFEKYNEQKYKIEQTLHELASPIHNLVMPYWVYTQEFNDESRKYFLAKKEKKRGPFSKLMAKKDIFLSELSPLIGKIEDKIFEDKFYQNEEFSILDILISSHLWGLYVFPEFQFTPKIHLYLQKVKSICHFSYHQDFYES